MTKVSFPFAVMQNLSSEDVERWNCFYKKPLVSERNALMEEGVWRRTQDQKNRKQSGWNDEKDKRSRMIQYQYHYDVVKSPLNNLPILAMTDFYLWLHLCMPEDEISVYSNQIYSGLQFGGWDKLFDLGNESLFSYGDLCMRIFRGNPGEIGYYQRAGSKFADEYVALEVTVFSVKTSKDETFISRPWEILKSGIRPKNKPGSPTLNPWNMLKDFYPAQIELGCGSSIEAGIPPLNFLHDVYAVTDKKSGSFVMDPYQDNLPRFVANYPQKALKLFSRMYKSCFTASLTNFYHTLKRMHDNGYFVGPIITNNFDGLVSRIGLQEMYVRRYDESHIVPKIKFHPKAKSLIVIGSHADRRRIQCAARRAGLKVIYVNPEGYFEADKFISSPIEAAQDEDFLFRITADEFAKRIKDVL